MGFDVTDLLGNLFGSGLAMATVAAVPSPDDGGRQDDDVGGTVCRLGTPARLPRPHGVGSARVV